MVLLFVPNSKFETNKCFVRNGTMGSRGNGEGMNGFRSGRYIGVSLAKLMAFDMNTKRTVVSACCTSSSVTLCIGVQLSLCAKK